jgi:bleomycin hydrolase
MKTLKLRMLTISILLMAMGFVQAQRRPVAAEQPSPYQFTDIKRLPATSVKDQNRSGTCWSFSANSFIESELLRLGKGEYDLSQMFIVKHAYADKAKRYVRFHGSLNFGGGGAFHDVVNMMRTYGAVPQEIYSGDVIGEVGPVHGEMDEVFKDYMDGVIKNPNKKLTPVWYKGFLGLEDAYLGAEPTKFTYKGKDYTPQTFEQSLGLNLDDYVEISSFTHHPFYSKFVLEVPDNWSGDEVYNVPLDEMIDIINNSIENGYTVAWATDVSEKGFKHNLGYANVPEDAPKETAGMEAAKWTAPKGVDTAKVVKPAMVKEKNITQEVRQEAFDNYETTDDHGLHIIGTAKDQYGTPFYIVKNSWNASSNKFGGYFYSSIPFVKYKTTCIMVNKKAIPAKIAKKLGL